MHRKIYIQLNELSQREHPWVFRSQNNVLAPWNSMIPPPSYYPATGNHYPNLTLQINFVCSWTLIKWNIYTWWGGSMWLYVKHFFKFEYRLFHFIYARNIFPDRFQIWTQIHRQSNVLMLRLQLSEFLHCRELCKHNVGHDIHHF